MLPGDVSCRMLTITRQDDGAFMLETELWIPTPRARAFEFFADARNLESLTPPWLGFRILTPQPIEMKEGALIDYQIRLRGLPMTWRTLISTWEPGHRFVDTQLRGPYREWIHEHAFSDERGGTLCRDTVRYRVPGGTLVNRWLVEPDVRRIFGFRRETMKNLFAAAD